MARVVVTCLEQCWVCSVDLDKDYESYSSSEHQRKSANEVQTKSPTQCNQVDDDQELPSFDTRPWSSLEQEPNERTQHSDSEDLIECDKNIMEPIDTNVHKNPLKLLAQDSCETNESYPISSTDDGEEGKNEMGPWGKKLPCNSSFHVKRHPMVKTISLSPSPGQGFLGQKVYQPFL